MDHRPSEPRRIDLVDRWSELKKAIERLPGPAGNPAQQAYKQLFTTLDQNLTGKLRAADRAAAAAKNGDAKSRAAWYEALKSAITTLDDYERQLDLVDDAMNAQFRGSWAIVRGQFQEIYEDVKKTFYWLHQNQ